jgi:hypothetical protein
MDHIHTHTHTHTHTQYEIRVTGHLGQTILGAFPELHGESCGPDTVLSGPLRDRSAVYGIVARLESLGLDLVDLRRVEPNTQRVVPSRTP